MTERMHPTASKECRHTSSHIYIDFLTQILYSKKLVMPIRRRCLGVNK